MAEKIPVIDLFGPTIQGEGMLIGVPTHFLRTGGCGYKCSWCDSMHAVDPAQVKANRTMMSIEEMVRAIDQLPRAPWLTLTGGDPCLHKGLGNLIGLMGHRNIKVCVETQGELWPEWLKLADVVTFSPKAPSSRNSTSIQTFRDNLVKFRQQSGNRVAVKVVVFNHSDLEYAAELYNALKPRVAAPLYDKFYFQVGSVLLKDAPDFTDDIKKMDPCDDGCDQGILRDQLTRQWMRNAILMHYEWLVGVLLQRVEELDANTAITPQMHTLLWPTEERGR